jgi:hypothetical protein
VNDRITTIHDTTIGPQPSPNGQHQPVPASQPLLRRLTEIEAKRLTWLWPPRFPTGKLSTINGDPGLGKSLLTEDITARVSTGAGWPDDPFSQTEAGSVVIVSAEDDAADTIRPRLEAAGADLNRIHVLEGIQENRSAKKITKRHFSLQRDLPTIDAMLRKLADVKAMIFDPITAYLDQVDSHKNAEVRGVLAPLAELAQRHSIAIIGVNHLNKGSGPALHRSMGSVAFIAAVRAAWLVARDKDDADRRLLLPLKNNLAPDQGGLAYRIVTNEGGIPYLKWETAAVNLTADDALRPDDQGDTEKAAAIDFLRQHLVSGAAPSKDIEQAAKDVGVRWRTLQRAKKALGVHSFREGFGQGAVWKWVLPHSQGDQ